MVALWPVVLAVFIGAALSFQPVINNVSAGILNSALAAATISLLTSAILVFSVLLMRGEAIRLDKILDLPWWVLLGGLAGAIFVSGGLILVPRIEVTSFFVCVIAGQLVGAVIADYIGAFGLVSRDLSISKLVGVFMAFLAVLFVRFG